MGRHSWSYISAQQEWPSASRDAGRGTAYIGRIGLLAVALGIGAAVAGGTATASADTPAGNSSADGAAQSATATASPAKVRSAASTADNDEAPANLDSRDDPGTPPHSGLVSVRHAGSYSGSGAGSAADDEADEAPHPVKTRSSRTGDRQDVESVSIGEDAAAPSASDTPVPSPTDQTATEFGDIGKWMLDRGGAIADYGGRPYEGKTVLEAVNVVIVDPTSRNALQATWRLNAAMRRAGFPPRMIHSTGFRGLIDDRRYRQQPGGLLVGYSDDFFLRTNNHGRIFGPDPLETASGYVWSGSFSTEKLVFQGILPRHDYVSSNTARAALAARLVASGRAHLGDVVSLDNSYNSETMTTGDHDGSAVVIVLNNPYAILAGREATGRRSCTTESAPALPAYAPCEAFAAVGRG